MQLNEANIQGNIVAAFNTRFQEFLGLRRHTGADIDQVRDWVASLGDVVTATETVRAERALMKSPDTAPGRTWIFAALGKALLQSLRPAAIFGSKPFNTGLRNRARGVMADRTEFDGWAIGGPATEPDVLLIIAGNHRDSVTARTTVILDAAKTRGFNEIYREMGVRLPDDREHFGFRDGISQPAIRMSPDADGVPAGQFVFGYENFDRQIAHALSNHADFGDLDADGTYMVFRRLRQDVEAFRLFCEREAERLRDVWPTASASHLAALIVGRWPDGQLVDASSGQQPPLPADLNAFDFANDLDGKGCPWAAHVRKVNPRKGGSDVATPERRRFLRRGIPFGLPFDEKPDDDRGLLFVAFQTSIHDQTDFVTQKWMNSSGTPKPGNDLLVGRTSYADEEATLTVKLRAGSVDVTRKQNGWVTPNGGAYMFAPSLRGFASLAN